MTTSILPPSRTPVVLMLFNRPDQTRQVFQAIAKVRPQKLLVIADGPRATHPDDETLCNQARAVIAEIDWPCELLTNFAPANLGCRERVISGLDWVFQNVEEAIILEDDCLPHETFFPYCEELLERYRDDTRIGMISGNNLLDSRAHAKYSYYHTRLVHIWGWATWRRAWRRYDGELRTWPSVDNEGILEEIFVDRRQASHWKHIFQSMHDGSGPNTWDHQLSFTMFANNMLSIAPCVNLVRNIGFGAGATHTTDANSDFAQLATGEMTFPLAHPPYVVPLRSLDEHEHQLYNTVPFARKLKRKIRRLAGSLLPSLVHSDAPRCDRDDSQCPQRSRFDLRVGDHYGPTIASFSSVRSADQKPASGVGHDLD